jgi:hypothetical protein
MVSQLEKVVKELNKELSLQKSKHLTTTMQTSGLDSSANFSNGKHLKISMIASSILYYKKEITSDCYY